MDEIKKHILITGSSGYLGQHLLQSLINEDNNIINDNYIITAAYGSLSSFDDNKNNNNNDTATPMPVPLPCRKVQLDLTSKSSIDSLFNSLEQPVDVLIHLAAMSSPAQCEKNIEKCNAINSPMMLLQSLPTTCDVIFLSTDQVYNGNPKLAPFDESDVANADPVNEYGKSKLQFESMLLERKNDKLLGNVIILRSSLMLGGKTPGECRKQSFLQFVHGRLVNGQSTDYFSDEIRCVVHVQDVVQVIQYFAFNFDNNDKGDISGVYNLGGADRVSRIDLALAIAKYLNMDESLCNSIQRFTPDFKGGGSVASPPDISVRMEKLKRITGIETMGLNEIVKNSF